MKVSLITSLAAPLLVHGFSIREAEDKGCAYGDLCWPTVSQWTAFNHSVGGKLREVHPISSVCHTTFGEYDAIKCNELQANWDVGIFVSRDAGGYPAHNWGDGHASDYCSINDPGSNHCGQGRIPPVFIESENVQDLHLAVNFVRKHNLKVRIKSTGHSFSGGASATGAFGISVHKLNGIKFHVNFKGKGQAVTVGAGVQFKDLYKAASEENVVIVGGSCESVSISGFTLGGGHSRYTPTYGLSVDQVLEFTMISPQGDFLVVNEKTFPDLWWAVRGGGSGFGIITSWTLKTYPPVRNEYVNNFQLVVPSKYWYQEGIYLFLKLQKSLRQAKWYDYTVSQQTNQSWVLDGTAFKPNIVSEESEKDLWKPLQQFAIRSGGTFKTNFTLYKSQYDVTVNEIRANFHVFPLPKKPLSRLVPISAFNNDSIVRQIAAFLAAQPAAIFIDVGPLFASLPPKLSPMALNPAWRSTLSHIIWLCDWAEGADLSQETAARGACTKQQTEFTKIIGSDAAYINESDADDESWPHNYYGNRYEKLLKIKEKWDPNHYFTCTGCVGSETPAGIPFAKTNGHTEELYPIEWNEASLSQDSHIF